MALFLPHRKVTLCLKQAKEIPSVIMYVLRSAFGQKMPHIGFWGPVFLYFMKSSALYHQGH